MSYRDKENLNINDRRSRSRERYQDRGNRYDDDRYDRYDRSRNRYDDRYLDRGSRYDRYDDDRSRSRRNDDRWKDRNDDRLEDRNDDRSRQQSAIKVQQYDANLPQKDDDPRSKEGEGKNRIRKKGTGRNTESFDPVDTLVRPDMRVIVGPNTAVLPASFRLKHDDVVIVPNFFCEHDDWTMYYKLIEEMREEQEKGGKDTLFISWHEGAHLISKNPSNCPTFQQIQEKIAKYFGIEMKSIGTRFNWYRDSSDWKPFHHDSAAFNPQRAKNQNITVGVSFGATRELAFHSASSEKTKIYFPQTNGMLFSFGRDVNIQWKHGINALKAEEQDGKGRVSIILWGLAPNVIEEEGSPPMLDDNTRGNGYNMHKNQRERDEICRDYAKGTCNYGDRCRFKH